MDQVGRRLSKQDPGQPKTKTAASQPDGVAVDSIVLSGGLARLKYLASYVEEKMGLPVQLAEPRHAQLRLPDPR